MSMQFICFDHAWLFVGDNWAGSQAHSCMNIYKICLTFLRGNVLTLGLISHIVFVHMFFFHNEIYGNFHK